MYSENNAKIKNAFVLPNEIFDLGLSSGELSVYAYLRRIEDRRTYQCWPSYSTVAKAIHKSKSSVKKYVDGLIEKKLITVEPTQIITKSGMKRNGSLCYTLLPLDIARSRRDSIMLAELEKTSEQYKALKRVEEYNRQNPQKPLCAEFSLTGRNSS